MVSDNPHLLLGPKEEKDVEIIKGQNALYQPSTKIQCSTINHQLKSINFSFLTSPPSDRVIRAGSIPLLAEREARQKHKSSFVGTYHSLFSNQQLKEDVEEAMFVHVVKHRSFKDLTPVRPCHPGGLGPSPKSREARHRISIISSWAYRILFLNQQQKVDVEEPMFIYFLQHRSFSFGEGVGG